jgi:hypothetical protein
VAIESRLDDRTTCSTARSARQADRDFVGECGVAPHLLKEQAGGRIKMKSTGVALVIAGCFASGCAGGAGLAQRGALVVSGDAVKAFAAGPAVVHAFSMDRGADIFTAPATTGTDADCARVRAGGHDRPTPIKVDQRNVVEVRSGQVACVASTSDRPIELLWHAKVPATATDQVLVAQTRR